MSEALDEARRKIEAAIDEYAALSVAEDVDETGVPILMGWGVVFEYTQESLEEREASGVVTVQAPHQYRGTSRGLFELAADKFRVGT